MANLTRSAKSGSDWTIGDLDAYNIRLVREGAATFFGIQDLPEPQVDQEILNVQDAIDMTVDVNQELINLLDLAMIPTDPEESAVDDFAVGLFRALRYASGHRVARTRKDVPLFICGEWRHAKTDVCIVDRLQNNIMLLVQEDKRFGEGEQTRADAEAQLVAEAIAAFCLNNRRRWEVGQPELESAVIPGIVMTGTTPSFFKVPVTSQLVTAIRHGQYPANPTVVAVHLPDTPRPNRRWSEGMKPLDNRQQILKCYEAFKTIVGI